MAPLARNEGHLGDADIVLRLTIIRLGLGTATRPAHPRESFLVQSRFGRTV